MSSQYGREGGREGGGRRGRGAEGPKQPRRRARWGRDVTCPVSTGGGARRVQLVREGGGGGGGGGRRGRGAEGAPLRVARAAQTPAEPRARPARPSAPPDSRHGRALPHEAAARSCGRPKWHDAAVQNGPRAAGHDLEGLVAVCGKVAVEVLQRVLGPARPASLRTDKVVLRERERD